MKKLFSIWVMIISTIITVYAIIFWQPSDIQRIKSYIYNEEVEESNVNFVEMNEVISASTIDYKIVEDEDEKSNKNITNTLIIEEEKSLEVSTQNRIFKIDEKKIESSLSKEEREKIETIIKKMSSVDLINIKESFKKQDKEEGVKDGFNLIKKRISVEDYNEIKKILQQYIDFTVLETEV